MAKVTIRIKQIEAEGSSPTDVLGRLARMKQELVKLGCSVSINIDGQEIDQIKIIDLPEHLRSVQS